MIKPIRRIGFSLCLLLCGFGQSAAFADTYPSRPIRLVVGLGPGGVGDITARAVAQQMSKTLGQQVVIDNKPGGGQIAALSTVAKSPPDGYTLVLLGSGNASTQLLFKDIPFEVLHDFTYISTMGYFDLAVFTSTKSPFQNLQELIKAAKDNPGKLNIATINVGSTQNLTAALLKAKAGIDVVIVPYKNSADVVSAILAGDVQAGIDMLAPIMPQIKAKALKPLALTSDKRFAGMPEVPTAIESGVVGFESSSWNGFAAPAGTPAPIIEKLNKAMREAVASPDTVALFRSLGVDARSSTPEQAQEVMKADIPKWKAAIDSAKIERQ